MGYLLSFLVYREYFFYNTLLMPSSETLGYSLQTAALLLNFLYSDSDTLQLQSVPPL
jgi:hypothetical protein